MNQEEIKQVVEQEDIHWIQVHFTDLFGRLKVLHISTDYFIKEDMLIRGFGFDGSSAGFADVETSDMIAMPDAETFLVLPHGKNEARILADIYDTSLLPSPFDPRYVLKKAVKTANDYGFDAVRISPEMEFFVLDENKRDFYEIKENEGYFCPPPLDDAKEYRRTLSNLLMNSGYNIKYHHHENGSFQHEIEISSLEAVGAADFCIYFKYLARAVASLDNLQVSFMPKLFSQEAGNGMHAHISLYHMGKNVFLDKNDECNLSQKARYFIGGILEHSKGMTAFANSTVNSYKRLIPDFEAPVHIAWAHHNRSGLIRIAARENIDVEIRNADPSANPYLFFAAMIHSGLDGIKKKIMYEPVEKNSHKMIKEELQDCGIKKLPTNLLEALEELEKDDVLKQAIGRELIEIYVEKKKDEWNRYMSEITDVDYDFYFNC